MKNIVTTQEIIYAFAKLQLWFDLSPLYRLNGFFDGVDEMVDISTMLALPTCLYSKECLSRLKN